MAETELPVTSVDAPSSWNIEDGPPESGVGSNFRPAALVSLTAPKPLVKHFQGRHFIGGRCVPRSVGGRPGVIDTPDRFVSPTIAAKYGFEVPEYEGVDQVVEVSSVGQKL